MMQQFWVEHWNGCRMLWQHKPWVHGANINGRWRVVKQLSGPLTNLNYTPGIQ